MNEHNKKGIKKIASLISYSISCTTQMLSSLLRVIVLSSLKVAYKSKGYSELRESDTCCVLGNGPSLKEALVNNEVKTEGCDIFAVNMFCQSEYFRILKPRFYFLVDGAFFSPQCDRHKEQVEILASEFKRVDWPMYLMISSHSVNGGLLNKIDNPNIKILRLNSTTIDGFVWFRHLMYRRRLGMPRCQTVVNYALSTGILMHYSEIFLYGADHTWTRDLFVDEDNVVCYGDRHVYNTNLTVIKHTRSMAEILADFSNMFATHVQIKKYADTENVRIINCTKGSFVDAYDRK